jgi:hypothetical protein
MYEGEERLSYMDRAVDLSQPDYKRFRLGKFADNVIGKFGKRNHSIDPLKKGTFVALKHPYEWNIKPKQPIPHSFIHSPKGPSGKVNNSSFDEKYYQENQKNNNAVLKGQEIA